MKVILGSFAFVGLMGYVGLSNPTNGFVFYGTAFLAGLALVVTTIYYRDFR